CRWFRGGMEGGRTISVPAASSDSRWPAFVLATTCSSFDNGQTWTADKLMPASPLPDPDSRCAIRRARLQAAPILHGRLADRRAGRSACHGNGAALCPSRRAHGKAAARRKTRCNDTTSCHRRPERRIEKTAYPPV